MALRLTAVINGESQLEYDRDKVLPSDQYAYLDGMDAKMDRGIQLSGQAIADPDALQRAQFVALQLVQAIEAGNEGMAAATCAYLAIRVPDLRQVKVDDKGNQRTLDLVFDRPHAPEVKLNFIRPGEMPS